MGLETAKTLSDAPATDAGGLGFVVTDDDPLVSIRLEDAVTNGEPEEWAKEIIDAVDTYAEYGPEETHILLLAQGTIPDGAERSSDVEMTDKERVFPVTGDQYFNKAA